MYVYVILIAEDIQVQVTPIVVMFAIDFLIPNGGIIFEIVINIEGIEVIVFVIR
jgi:hypothetical protein